MSFHQNRRSGSIQNLFHHQCQMTCLELNEMRNFRRQPCIRYCTMHIPTMRGAVVFYFLTFTFLQNVHFIDKMLWCLL